MKRSILKVSALYGIVFGVITLLIGAVIILLFNAGLIYNEMGEGLNEGLNRVLSVVFFIMYYAAVVAASVYGITEGVFLLVLKEGGKGKKVFLYFGMLIKILLAVASVLITVIVISGGFYVAALYCTACLVGFVLQIFFGVMLLIDLKRRK